MSNTASWIFYISFAPWNKVYVAVKHGLPGSLDRLSAPQLANRRHIPTVSEAIMVGNIGSDPVSRQVFCRRRSGRLSATGPKESQVQIRMIASSSASK